MLFWNNIFFWWLKAELVVCELTDMRLITCKLKVTELAICKLETELIICELKNARFLTCKLKAELIICELRNARFLTCKLKTELIICELKDARLLTCELKIILKISRFWTCHTSWNLTEKKNCFFSEMTAETLTKNEMQYFKQNWKIRMRMLLSKLNMISYFLSHEWLKTMRYYFKSMM